MLRAAGLLALALLVLACALWLFRTPLLTFAGRFLVNDEAPRKADAILVLGGDDFGRRILKAAQLANLIGHESDATIQFAEQNGYPASLFRAVWLPPGTDSTRSEATFLGKYLKTHGINRILLVTSNYHTGRAARIWRTQAPWIAITVVAASDPFFTPAGWWKSRSGQKTFLFEWMKTVSTWLGN
jgi:uncharacterized SAM-binding protein YcdF (DUF218 family)